MPQRRADEDEIEGAEREDAPETTERQSSATDEEIKEAEREDGSSAGVFLVDLEAAAARERAATEEETQEAEEENADSDRPSHGLLPNEPHHADQRIADEDEIEAAERKPER